MAREERKAFLLANNTGWSDIMEMAREEFNTRVNPGEVVADINVVKKEVAGIVMYEDEYVDLSLTGQMVIEFKATLDDEVLDESSWPSRP